MRDLIVGEAELDDEEDDESFDEETGEARERSRKQGREMDDSSEEEDDDDDEEEARKVIHPPSFSPVETYMRHQITDHAMIHRSEKDSSSTRMRMKTKT